MEKTGLIMKISVQLESRLSTTKEESNCIIWVIGSFNKTYVLQQNITNWVSFHICLHDVGTNLVQVVVADY